jgi:hypothetical protein
MSRLLIIISFSFTVLLNTALTPDNSCKALIEQYIKKMAGINAPSGNKVYYMHYSIRNYYNIMNGSKNPVIDFKITKSSDRLFYESTLMSMYIDKNNSYLIVPEQKQIVQSKSDADINDADNLNNIIQLQDSIVKTSKVVDCKDEEYNGKMYRTISLEPVRAIKEKKKVKGMKYYFNIDDNNLYMVVIYYDYTNPVLQQVYTYHEINFNYKKNIAKSAKDMIYTSAGQLKNKYLGYEIINNDKNN